MIYSNKKAIIAINAAIWLVVIAILTTITQLMQVQETFLMNFGSSVFGTVALLCPITYLNSLFLIPQLVMKRKFVVYFLSLLVIVPVWTIATLYIDYYTFESLGLGDGGDSTDYWTSFFPYLFISGFLFVATLVNLSYRWFFQLQQIQAMEQAQISNELALLKAQINPHFFFNTLNNLYALALENSPQTPSTILVLSNLMRYVIYDANTEKTILQDEVKYIENYISLQKIRLLHPEKIVFKKEIQFEKLMLPPLLLIIFIENAFKYSVGTMAENAYIHLAIVSNDKQIQFSIENNYDPARMTDRALGIGLTNARKRLDLIYGKKYDLVTRDQSGIYAVTLTLPALWH
jgi:hypothetical protein